MRSLFSNVCSAIVVGFIISCFVFSNAWSKCNRDITKGLFCPSDHLMIFLKVNNDWTYPHKRKRLCQALFSISGAQNYTCIFQKKNKPGLCPNLKGFGFNCINYFYNIRKGGKKCIKVLKNFQVFFSQYNKNSVKDQTLSDYCEAPNKITNVNILKSAVNCRKGGSCSIFSFSNIINDDIKCQYGDWGIKNKDKAYIIHPWGNPVNILGLAGWETTCKARHR